ncbi:MAG: hypothetical protein KAX49_05315 [Halanaerobiales bacterium]|nr:hypothetical protein [Halanaerobiales bacterium]
MKFVELGDAESVEMTIKMSAGELKLAGGSSKLLEAKFTYNNFDWEPETEYNIKDKIGELIVQHPEYMAFNRI